MNSTNASLIAELNDLIQLDHDAVEAFTIAINTLKNQSLRDIVVAYRADHKRHIEDLAALVRERGGLPIELPHPTAALKLAVQAAGGLGGDHAVLLALKAVEGQVRDKYRWYADRSYPADVAAVVHAAAADEDTHYRWISKTLEDLGYGEGTISGQLERLVESVHKAIANPVERVGRAVAESMERMRPHHRHGNADVAGDDDAAADMERDRASRDRASRDRDAGGSSGTSAGPMGSTGTADSSPGSSPAGGPPIP